MISMSSLISKRTNCEYQTSVLAYKREKREEEEEVKMRQDECEEMSTEKHE